MNGQLEAKQWAWRNRSLRRRRVRLIRKARTVCWLERLNHAQGSEAARFIDKVRDCDSSYCEVMRDQHNAQTKGVCRGDAYLFFPS
jgi:hypothetical protein